MGGSRNRAVAAVKLNFSGKLTFRYPAPLCFIAASCTSAASVIVETKSFYIAKHQQPGRPNSQASQTAKQSLPSLLLSDLSLILAGT